ncbi:MAG: type II toxin-antitoxin system RelE family toxin [Microcystaceae cyanobacterium]
MTYQMIIPTGVQKQIKKLPREIQDDILNCLIKLQTNPRPSGYLKMKNTEGYRIRRGDYRILYSIDDQEQKIKLRRIGHRRDVYK